MIELEAGVFKAVDARRQHIGEKARIRRCDRHGDAAPNVVPDLARADFLAKEVTRERTLGLVDRHGRDGCGPDPGTQSS